VDIFLLVAGKAVLRGRPEVLQGVGIDVAQSAGLTEMFPGQREGQGVMIEIAIIGLHPIVAGQAVLPKILCVDRHICRIDLRVAGLADGLVKRGGVDFSMTVRTSIDRTVRLGLVDIERVTQRFVREADISHIR